MSVCSVLLVEYLAHSALEERSYGLHGSRVISKVPVHRAYQLLCFRGMPMNTKANLKTVGSEAYVQFSTFVT